MSARPRHLAPEFGAQFRDDSVAAVYRKRPPYPAGLFDRLAELLPSAGSALLDLGCGTGEIAIPMAARAGRVDALDPSRAMLRVARRLAASRAPDVRWIEGTAEERAFPGTYGLVVAASSLHWMDWKVVLAKIAAVLEPRGRLAIVNVAAFGAAPWLAPLRALIAEYSTNRHYRVFDLVAHLRAQRLFTEIGREALPGAPFEQRIDDYVDSFHARNGFSLDRMAPGRAREFDAAVRRLVAPHAVDGLLRTCVRATLVWGRPSGACAGGRPADPGDAP